MLLMLPKCCSATPREQQNHVALEPKMWSAQSICPFLYLFSARINRLLYYVFLREERVRIIPIEEKREYKRILSRTHTIKTKKKRFILCLVLSLDLPDVSC